MSTTGSGTHDTGTPGLGSARVEGAWNVSLVLSPERSVAVPTHFTYRADDPYAVHLDFYTGSRQPVPWCFARELLAAGMRAPTGHADVRVWPDHDRDMLCLALTPLEGETLLRMPTEPLATWLEHTYELVPSGDEEHFFDLDASLERLLQRSAVGEPQGTDGSARHTGPVKQPGLRDAAPRRCRGAYGSADERNDDSS